MAEEITDFSAALADVLALVEDHRVFDAHAALEKLEAELEACSDGDKVKEFKEGEWAAKEPDITLLRYNYKSGTDLLHDLHDDEGWELGGEKANIKTYLKTHSDLDYTLISVKGRCEIGAPVQNVVMLMNEIDLYHKWVPLVKKGEFILEMNDFDKLMHVMFSFPMPINFVMSARDLTFRGCVNETADASWVVSVRDCRPEEKERIEREHSFEIPESEKGYVRCQLVNGGMYLKPHSQSSCTVECMLSINPQLNLPVAIVRLLCSKFAVIFFDMLSKRATKLPGKEYDDRLDKPLYVAIRERLASMFPE